MDEGVYGREGDSRGGKLTIILQGVALEMFFYDESFVVFRLTVKFEILKTFSYRIA